MRTGIGGVHRGGESSMDVSADLAELGRSPLAVVCAGVKSILDIPRTLEVSQSVAAAVLCFCLSGMHACPGCRRQRLWMQAAHNGGLQPDREWVCTRHVAPVAHFGHSSRIIGSHLFNAGVVCACSTTEASVTRWVCRVDHTDVKGGNKSEALWRALAQVLETQGVCVAAYGANEFPAFFTACSGYKEL